VLKAEQSLPIAAGRLLIRTASDIYCIAK